MIGNHMLYSFKRGIDLLQIKTFKNVLILTHRNQISLFFQKLRMLLSEKISSNVVDIMSN